jgi:hypothetical protein
MKKFLIALVLGFWPASQSQAAIVFTLSPATQNITQGSVGIFNLFLRSDTVPLQIDGIDVNVNAGAGNGTGGVFQSSPTFLLGSAPFDVTSTPGQAFSTNFAIGGISLGTTNTLYGILSLGTTGVTPGTYALTMDTFRANSPTSAGQPTIAVNASYTIQAIPEPGTIVLMGVSIAGLIAFRVIRARRTSC